MYNTEEYTHETATKDILVKRRLGWIMKCCITETVCGGMAFILGIVLVVMYPGTPIYPGSPPTGIWAGILAAFNGILGMSICGNRNTNTGKMCLGLLSTFGLLGVVGAMNGLYIRDLVYVVNVDRPIVQLLFDIEILPALVMISFEILFALILLITVVIHLTQLGKIIDAIISSKQQVGVHSDLSTSSSPAKVEVHPILSSHNPVGYVNHVGPQAPAYSTTNQSSAPPPTYQSVEFQLPTPARFNENPAINPAFGAPVPIAPSQY